MQENDVRKDKEYIGWLKTSEKGSRWVAVCWGDTWDHAIDQLISLNGGRSCEKIVLRRGKHPNDK